MLTFFFKHDEFTTQSWRESFCFLSQWDWQIRSQISCQEEKQRQNFCISRFIDARFSIVSWFCVWIWISIWIVVSIWICCWFIHYRFCRVRCVYCFDRFCRFDRFCFDRQCDVVKNVFSIDFFFIWDDFFFDRFCCDFCCDFRHEFFRSIRLRLSLLLLLSRLWFSKWLKSSTIWTWTTSTFF